MNLNPFSIVPSLMQRVQTHGFSSIIPSLDSIVRIANPRFIAQDSWLRTLVDTAMMPAASAIILFALAGSLIQEQRRAASGGSDFSRIFYRLIFHVAVLSGYHFFFTWAIDATQAIGDLFLQDREISGLTDSMYRQFASWNLGPVRLGQTVLVGLVAYVTYLFAFVLFMIFFLARYMILALFFVVGPLVIAFSVWEATSRFRVWLVGLVQVASWIVVMKFIIAVSLSLSFDKIYGTDQINLIYVIAANILYVVMLWSTPAIASVLVGSAGLGFLGSIIVGVATEKTMDAASLAWRHTLGQREPRGPMPPSRGAGAQEVLSAARDPYGAFRSTGSL